MEGNYSMSLKTFATPLFISSPSLWLHLSIFNQGKHHDYSVWQMWLIKLWRYYFHKTEYSLTSAFGLKEPWVWKSNSSDVEGGKKRIWSEFCLYCRVMLKVIFWFIWTEINTLSAWLNTFPLYILWIHTLFSPQSPDTQNNSACHWWKIIMAKTLIAALNQYFVRCIVRDNQRQHCDKYWIASEWLYN